MSSLQTEDFNDLVDKFLVITIILEMTIFKKNWLKLFKKKNVHYQNKGNWILKNKKKGNKRKKCAPIKVKIISIFLKSYMY